MHKKIIFFSVLCIAILQHLLDWKNVTEIKTTINLYLKFHLFEIMQLPDVHKDYKADITSTAMDI